MHSLRRLRALTACLTLLLVSFALPAQQIGADESPVVTYQVVASYDAAVSVNGGAADVGVDYSSGDVLEISAASPDAYVVVSRNENGSPVDYQTYYSDADAVLFSDVFDQFIWIDD